MKRNLDSAISWVERLADGQDCRTKKEESDGYL